MPLQVRLYKWSGLNVPLIWAAAGVEDTVPVLGYLATTAAAIPYPIDIAGQSMPAKEGLAYAWRSLRQTFRDWGVNTPDQLADWIGRHGHRRPRPGTYFNRDAQRSILEETCSHNANVSGLETVYVQIVLFLSRQPQPAPPQQTQRPPPTQGRLLRRPRLANQPPAPAPTQASTLPRFGTSSMP